MNTTQIYKKAVSTPEPPDSEANKQAEAKRQAEHAEQQYKQEWLEHPYTQKFIGKLEKDIENLKQTVIDLSNLPDSFGKTGRDSAIKAKTLQNLIDTYAS